MSAVLAIGPWSIPHRSKIGSLMRAGAPGSRAVGGAPLRPSSWYPGVRLGRSGSTRPPDMVSTSGQDGPGLGEEKIGEEQGGASAFRPCGSVGQGMRLHLFHHPPRCTLTVFSTIPARRRSACSTTPGSAACETSRSRSESDRNLDSRSWHRGSGWTAPGWIRPLYGRCPGAHGCRKAFAGNPPPRASSPARPSGPCRAR